MRARVFAACALVTAAAAAAASLSACSDDGDARAPFVPDPAPDAQATLPDGAPPADGGPAIDAKGPYDPNDEAVTCTATPCAVEIASGTSHFCARFDDGTVRCWGNTEYGTLGAAATPDAGDAGKTDASTDAGDAGDGGIVIHAVGGLPKITQLSAAGDTTCARAEDGRIFCWGRNSQGQLGLATFPAVSDDDAHPVPKVVPLAGPATRVDVGPTSACAVLATGVLSCWGSNEQQQLARPDSGAGVSFGEVRGPGAADLAPVAVVRSAPATHTTLGLTQTGEVYSWGALASYQGVLAGRVSSLTPDRTPRRIEGLTKVTSLATSKWFLPDPIFTSEPGGGLTEFQPPAQAHACVVASGEVLCWGGSEKGALCTGLPDPEPTPRDAPVSSKAWPQQVAVAEELTCARLTDGSVQCCGADEKGRLGTGSAAAVLYSAYFTPAFGFTSHAVKVSTADTAVCALVQGGTVECWGGNEHGELGGRTVDSTSHPFASPVAF